MAAALGMDRATMMAITDRLEDRGFVIRKRSDRRPAPPGAVSDAGRNIQASQGARPASPSTRRAVKALFKPAELAVFLEALEEIPGSGLSVSFEKHGDIAVALVDRPPVNAIDAGVRAGLLSAASRAASDPAVNALVIACRGRTFMSGADLSELGSIIPPPSYADVLQALESCAKPVIAAMHGTILGGGLEVAMACHYRCATRTARLGMPEITLGILPGAGGTQRLPRLIGVENALDMLLSGAPVDGARALELGLIDEIVRDDVVDGGIAFARRLLEKNAVPRLARSKPAPSDADRLDDRDVAGTACAWSQGTHDAEPGH